MQLMQLIILLNRNQSNQLTEPKWSPRIVLLRHPSSATIRLKTIVQSFTCETGHHYSTHHLYTIDLLSFFVSSNVHCIWLRFKIAYSMLLISMSIVSSIFKRIHHMIFKSLFDSDYLSFQEIYSYFITSMFKLIFARWFFCAFKSDRRRLLYFALDFLFFDWILIFRMFRIFIFELVSIQRVQNSQFL